MGGRTPSTVHGAMERYGWSTRDLAQQLGVSERTARRYAQQNRITGRGAAERAARQQAFQQSVTREARARQRRRMERGGLSSLSAAGEYQISKRRFRTGPGSRVRTGPSGEKIPASAMREYFAALDAGNQAEADRVLNDALADAYDASGLHMTDVDDVTFTI